MSKASNWELTFEETTVASIKVPIGEWQTPYAVKAQYLKLAYGIVDWLLTHEAGGDAWAARLVEELEEGGFRSDS